MSGVSLISSFLFSEFIRSEGESGRGFDGSFSGNDSNKDFCCGETLKSCGRIELLSNEGGEEGKRLSPFASGS